MGLYSPINEWGGIIQSHDVRLGSTYGVTVTPAQNAYGSYASIIAGSSVTFDVYEIEITIAGIGVSGAATDSLTTIGLDAAGGTSFTDTINHLLTSYAGVFGNSLTAGITYRFPLYIKNGTSIGAKGSINRATVGTQKVSVILYGKPSRPDLIRAGQFVTTFGATTSTSNGTAVTAGTTSEGSYTQLGSAISGARLWFWQVAAANANDAAHNNAQCAVDLAIGSSTGTNKLVIANQIVLDDSTENNSANYRGAYGVGVNGDNVYARIQSATATTAYSAIAYGVGG